ncbi:MAG: ABC transporter permease subunit [Planctomycetota bacterium]
MQAVGRWLWQLVPGNPMVWRIVLGGGRRVQHLWIRMGYLGVLIGLVLIGLLSGDALQGTLALDELAKSSALVFQIIAYGQVILICLLAPLFMAGTIASEQSGKTYNILLTTPLSNLQIVLGSLVGRLFFILALLGSGLPLFAVLLVFGGLPAGNVGVCFGVAAMTALSVGSVAVTLSVLRVGGRKAVFAFVIGIAAFLVLFYLLDFLLLRRLASGTAWEGRTTWVTPVHPLLVLTAYLNRANYAPPEPELLAGYPALVRFYLGRPFETFIWLGGVLSVVLLLFCSLGVRKVGTGQGPVVAWIRGKLRLRVGGEERRRVARDLGTGNPVAWREANTRGKLAAGIVARYGFLVLGLSGAGLLLLRLHWDPSWASGGVSTGQVAPHEWFREALLAILLIEVMVISLVAIYMSAGSVSREREDGTLDIMLTTPITPRAYVWGKLRGLVAFLSVLIAVPVLTLGLVAGYAWIGGRLSWPAATYTHTDVASGEVTAGVPLVYPEAAVVFAMMFIPFVAVCVAWGMLFSLGSRSVLGAVTKNMAIVGTLALVSGFCGFSAAGTIPLVGPAINALSPTTNMLMLTDPFNRIRDFGTGPTGGRLLLGLSALSAAGVYGLVVWSLVSGMVRGFDQTVRRLSGS